MSNNLKVLLVVLALGVFSVGGTYLYFTTDSFDLLKQAKKLYAEGDIYEAHDVVTKALMADLTNRQAIALKAELYGEVRNDSSLVMAKDEYKQGMDAYRGLRYGEAVNHFANALGHIDNISHAAKQYDAGQELEREIYKENKEVTGKINEQRYNNALRMYRSGNLMRAYEQLTYVRESSPPIDMLRNNIAYDLGVQRYNEIINSSLDLGYTYYSDAVYWLSQVSSISGNYQTAQQMIGTLKEKDKRGTEK